jgi:chemotaxis protein methyltransferase CheR
MNPPPEINPMSTQPPPNAPGSISPDDYTFLQGEIYRESGIVVDADKHYLLEARLTPLLRSAGILTLTDLCTRLRSRTSAHLTRQVMEALTTNETLFFRDMGPFEALQHRLLPEFAASLPETQPLKVWSAAASTGQEAYSIAMLLHEHGWQNRQTNILGTDISEHVLRVARAGKYVQFEVNRGLPAKYLVKYFTREGIDWLVKPEIMKMVDFRQFDLRQPTSALGRFHIIFCRNVLIYFDLETRNKILIQLWSSLDPGGYLILGGAESILHLHDRFERIAHSGTALYRKR